jgi:hypothetical protein
MLPDIRNMYISINFVLRTYAIFFAANTSLKNRWKKRLTHQICTVDVMLVLVLPSSA